MSKDFAVVGMRVGSEIIAMDLTLLAVDCSRKIKIGIF